MRSPFPRRVIAGVAAVGALALLGACSNDSRTDTDDAASLLEAAASTLTDTDGVTVELSTPGLPSGVNGLTAAQGTANPSPAFSGTITVSIAGTAADVAVVSVGGTVYAVLPFTSGYQEVDPADYGAPDPASLVASDTGVAAMLRATTGAEVGDSVRGGPGNADVLTPVSGELLGKDVQAIIPNAAGDTFDVEWQITQDGELRTAEVTGVFYAESEETTYTLTFTEYGHATDIKAPETR